MVSFVPMPCSNQEITLITLVPSLYLSYSGCDGKNYSNPCDAHSQGVSISYMGECNAVPEKGDGIVLDYANPSSSSNVTDGNKTLESIEGIPRSAASILSTLSVLAAVVAVAVSIFLN